MKATSKNVYRPKNVSYWIVALNQGHKHFRAAAAFPKNITHYGWVEAVSKSPYNKSEVMSSEATF